MTTPKKENALFPQGVLVTSDDKVKVITKLQRVTNLLKSRPQGTNRYEAEQYGDHCLNSTVAVIRAMYGDRLIQRWEVVPTRYNPAGVRVLRYWLI